MPQKEREARVSDTYSEASEFLCERRLKALNPQLHTCYRSSVFAMDMLLANYKTFFPFFTNHTFEHSAQVVHYCNVLAGAENVERLNADELYVLMMGACLHDIGMGISESVFQETRDNVAGIDDYLHDHPDCVIAEVIREFHQEFSAQCIIKFRDLFEIPSDEHLYCICQIARGHRRYDLLDKTAFDPAYTLPNGNIVHLPYLTALVKMADELDVTADRNLMFNYTNLSDIDSETQIMCYKCHKALLRLTVENGALVLLYQTEEPAVRDVLLGMEKKAQQVFAEFSSVVRERTDFRLMQSGVRYQESR